MHKLLILNLFCVQLSQTIFMFQSHLNWIYFCQTSIFHFNRKKFDLQSLIKITNTFYYIDFNLRFMHRTSYMMWSQWLCIFIWEMNEKCTFNCCFDKCWQFFSLYIHEWLFWCFEPFCINHALMNKRIRIQFKVFNIKLIQLIKIMPKHNN